MLNDCVTYVPRYNFSRRSAQLNIATITNNNGANTDTKSGPLLWMHHDIMQTPIPEHTTPCNNYIVNDHEDIYFIYHDDIPMKWNKSIHL